MANHTGSEAVQLDVEQVQAPVPAQSQARVRVNRVREERLPVAADIQYWAPKCKPLHVFLLEGRKTWPEIFQWAAQNRVPQGTVRNMLAWLELMCLADGDGRGWMGRRYGSP